MASDGGPARLGVVIDDASGLTLRFSGEIDMETAEQFRRSLESAAERTAGDVLIDLSGVTFLDSVGIGRLVGAANQLSSGRRFVIQRASGRVRVVLDITGITRLATIALEPDET